MAQANRVAILAETWDKHLTLEGPTDWGEGLYEFMHRGLPHPYRPEGPHIKTGIWQGERYWKVWNYRTGEREWRTADEAPSPRPAPRRIVPWRAEYRLRLARARSDMELADRARSESPQKAPERRNKANVLEEQIAILREINASQHLIELAERVLREGFARKEEEKPPSKPK